MNRHAAAAGKRVGGRRAFGYETDGLTIRESEAALWREMADRFLDGASIYRLTLDLQDRGVRTAGGGTFSPSRLRDVLRNPRYAALRTYHGEIVADAEWPPLIDRVRWERLIAMLNDPTRKTTPGPAPKHLLSGLLWCGKCGKRLGARKQHDQRAYGCRSRAAGGCGGVTVMAESLEQQVMNWLFEALDDSRLPDAIADHETATDDAEISDEIDELERRLDELAGAFADGEINRRQLASASDTLLARHDQLRSRLAPRHSILATVVGPEVARDLWASEGLAFRRELIRAAIARIIVNPASIRGWNFHDPGRVEIHPN
jgi:hypothetical protein